MPHTPGILAPGKASSASSQSSLAAAGAAGFEHPVALDRSKVLQTAQRYLAKGAYDRAITEYQRLVDEDPQDLRTWLKIGDLHTRRGARKEAAETYERVARHYAEQGFFLKAVAVYKQILKLDPTRIDVFRELAEMYARLEMTNDAMSTYEHVAANYARAGQLDKVIKVLRRMCEIDPENVPTRIKLAEALSRANKPSEAADEFEHGAAFLKRQNRMEDYIKVAERLLYHRPTDSAVARELAGLYLQRQDAKRALAKLQLCFQADPRDVGTLELLARAFEQLGQTLKTISVYREVARIHQEADRTSERLRVLRRIVELDPDDAEAKQALASTPEPAEEIAAPARAEKAPEQVDEEPELLDEDDEIELLEPDDEDLIVVEEATAEQAEEALTEDAPLPETSGTVESTVARLLAECDAFERYGLKSKLIAQLGRIIALDPWHIEARERLKDALLEAGKTDEAIAQLRALVELFENDQPQVAELYLKQLLQLTPEDSSGVTDGTGSPALESSGVSWSNCFK